MVLYSSVPLGTAYINAEACWKLAQCMTSVQQKVLIIIIIIILYLVYRVSVCVAWCACWCEWSGAEGGEELMGLVQY